MASNTELKREQKMQETLRKIQNITHKEKEVDAVIAQKNIEKKILYSEKKELQSRLKQLAPKQIKISDHALLRYFERFIEVDIAQITLHIISELESSDYKTVDGLEAVIVNNSLVTLNKK